VPLKISAHIFGAYSRHPESVSLFLLKSRTNQNFDLLLYCSILPAFLISEKEIANLRGPIRQKVAVLINDFVVPQFSFISQHERQHHKKVLRISEAPGPHRGWVSIN
jgi:hypothetical protein